MALKQVLKEREIREKREELDRLNAGKDALAERRAALTTREAQLETAVGEVTEETSAEDRAKLDEETEKWQQDDAALTGEEEENQAAREKIEGEIVQLEAELDEMSKRARKSASAKAAGRNDEKRTEEKTMNTRKKFFGMSMQERDAFLADGDVIEFLTRVRNLGKQERAVTGAELLIPTVVLDLISENVAEYSKLYKHVRVRTVSGKARQSVMGTVPEAVWTEMCAKVNELTMSFAAVEVDGYKVGGLIYVCKALLEDSDINLAEEIIGALGQAIGIALDKAILYGTGTKMPLGIVTRLAQTAAPESYPANARPWANLSASNVKTITAANSAGLKAYQEILKAFGNAKSKHSAGGKFFAMSEATYNTLMAEALSINAAGAIVSGQNGVMPVIGGAIETLSFIPDNVIIGGYGDLYLLTERAGTAITQSEHYRFAEDQVTFKATARYDGMPVIAEGFVAIGLNGTAVSASAVTFAADTANAT